MATCQRCQSEVSADALVCPHCEWEPRKRGHPGLLAIVGFVLTLTGVGAIVGIPLVFAAGGLMWYRHNERPATANPG